MCVCVCERERERMSERTREREREEHNGRYSESDLMSSSSSIEGICDAKASDTLRMMNDAVDRVSIRPH